VHLNNLNAPVLNVLNGVEYIGTDITSVSDDVLSEVHTTVHSLTRFTQNIVTDRGYIHTTALKLYLLHYLYNTCFTQKHRHLQRLYLYHCIQLYLNYSICMIIYNSCERDLVTNNMRLAYCIVLL